MYDSQQGRSASHRSQSIGLSLTVEYWVVDETGGVADPDLIAGLPGADATESPYSVAIETPPCRTCRELQRLLVDQLSTTVRLAHKRGCRLLAVGIRPDLLAAGDVDWDRVSRSATAGTRIVFEPNPASVVDCYNVVLALDPAFVFVNTTSLRCGRQQYACGRPALSACERQLAAYRTVDSNGTVAGRADSRADDEGWQPVRLVNGDSKIEWHSPDPATPTLLADFIADITTILREAAHYRISVNSFGNGFHGNRLVLPSVEWRAIYTDEAIKKGPSSVLLSAYLERLGFETEWYRSSTPTAVDGSSAEAVSTCRRHADLLDADVGRSRLRL